MNTEEYLALRDSVIFLPRITDRPEHRVMPLYTGWAGTYHTLEWLHDLEKHKYHTDKHCYKILIIYELIMLPIFRLSLNFKYLIQFGSAGPEIIIS